MEFLGRPIAFYLWSFVFLFIVIFFIQLIVRYFKKEFFHRDFAASFFGFIILIVLVFILNKVYPYAKYMKEVQKILKHLGS